MANINQPQQMGYNLGDMQRNNQYPYNNGNNLIMNTPYDNYMGRFMSQQTMMPNQYLKCRPVSSRQQAMAFQIDLDGSLWVFTNVAQGKIYTKQINNDGTATFNTYVFTQEKEEINNSQQYVTRSQFNKAIQGLVAAMQANATQNQTPATQETPSINF